MYRALHRGGRPAPGAQSAATPARMSCSRGAQSCPAAGPRYSPVQLPCRPPGSATGRWMAASGPAAAVRGSGGRQRGGQLGGHRRHHTHQQAAIRQLLPPPEAKLGTHQTGSERQRFPGAWRRPARRRSPAPAPSRRPRPVWARMREGGWVGVRGGRDSPAPAVGCEQVATPPATCRHPACPPPEHAPGRPGAAQRWALPQSSCAPDNTHPPGQLAPPRSLQRPRPPRAAATPWRGPGCVRVGAVRMGLGWLGFGPVEHASQPPVHQHMLLASPPHPEQAAIGTPAPVLSPSLSASQRTCGAPHASAPGNRLATM